MAREPIYVLPHGIEVMAELPLTEVNRYVRVLIREHQLFDAKVSKGIQLVRRSRAVMTAKLGRKLERNECVHHKNEDRNDDSPGNLEIISPAEHNKHHKTGYVFSYESKNKISTSIRKKIATGTWKPKSHMGSSNGQARLDDEMVRMIRSSNESAQSISRRIGISASAILAARTGKTWAHVK